jgi:hypothetical protein
VGREATVSAVGAVGALYPGSASSALSVITLTASLSTSHSEGVRHCAEPCVTADSCRHTSAEVEGAGRPAVAIFSGIMPGAVSKTYTETTRGETPFYIWVFLIVTVTPRDLTITKHDPLSACNELFHRCYIT